MATKSKRSQTGRTALYSGPHVGVNATKSPYDASPDRLVDAKNGYVVDPTTPSTYAGRPGWRRLFGGAPLVTQTTPFRGQEIYSHTNLDGTTINFLVCAGKLFRVDQSLSTATDVTPVGVTIDGGIMTRVFFASLIGTLFVTDGVNRPWIATDLTSTPITGTYIDYDGLGGSWTTFGKPVVYLGAVVVILNKVNGVSRRVDISWCNAGTLAIGWQQADFDNNMTLSQNEAGVLYALSADNVSLRYYRDGSIGSITGSDITQLASTPTDDAVAFNIGTQSAQAIQKFSTGRFFIDAQGRPYWLETGQAPLPIWKQMRSFVEDATTNYPTTTAIVSTSAMEPTFNLYIVGIWSPNPNEQAPPVDLHVFDAQTRIYQGRWGIGPEGTEPGIDVVGTLTDSAGRATLVVIAQDGFCWALNALGATPENLATNDGRFLCTEDGNDLVTEGQAQQWTDDGEIPDIQFTTDRLGFDENTNWNVDQGVVVTLNDTPVRVTVGTSAMPQTLEGIPQPSASQDGTYRLPFGTEVFGRGPSVTVKPLTADAQFLFERCSLVAIPSLAGPEDS